MTGAGERARELAAIHEAIERGWNKWEAASCTDLLCGCVTGWIEREIEPVLTGALAAVRLETVEEIAVFAETHYCIIKADEPSGYKTETRAKHPNEPFARAIRALGERAVEGK